MHSRPILYGWAFVFVAFGAFGAGRILAGNDTETRESLCRRSRVVVEGRKAHFPAFRLIGNRPEAERLLKDGDIGATAQAARPSLTGS